ncbi:MAG: T9SS type A sorting domain-containing protein [Bacteroidales bacterium]|nr:T9SS type A sorting domain-containing protein [Bacteroidales bacterium]
MKKVLFSLFALLLLSVSGIAQTTYTMVNSAAQLEPGQYILVGYDNEGQAFVMSYQKSNNRHALTIDENGGVITATVATDPSQQDAPYEFTLDGAPGAWTLFDPLNNGYLYAPGGGNYLRTQTDLNDNGRWTITDGEEGGMVPVSNGGVEQCYMRYNIISTLFGCYKESSNVAAPVYFFKAGGAAQPDPEPSNYPTQFTAAADGIDVYVVWQDATGAQLPSKYLVLASTGNITVPVDGTPVPDSDLAKNVPYGINGVVFEGLEPNTTYHFAIFPYTNSGSNIDYKTDGTYPTAEATTEEVYVLLYEDFNDDLGVFFTFDAYGDQTWHQGTYQGTTYANMNGYADGAAHQNEDWLIGYAEIPNGLGFDEIWVEFRTAMKFDGDPLRVAISTDYDGISEPSDFEWEDITDAFDYSTGNYEWVESGALDVSDIVGNHSFYIAFIYTSSDEAAASWEIDYVKVTGQHMVGVNENAATTVGVYPNPASAQVSFTLDSDAQVSVFDMTGRMVREMNATAGEAQLNVSELENGVYFVNFRYANGTTAVAKFVKF